MDNQKSFSKEALPISFNKTVNIEKPTLVMKARNAWEMIFKEGFRAFLYKIRRLLYYKGRALLRRIFNSQAGEKLREEAYKYYLAERKLPKLSVIVTVLGQHELSKLCLSKLVSSSIGKMEIVVMDGGGDFVIAKGDLPDKPINIKVVTDKGGYPNFKFWMENTTGDILLFIHNDIMIEENGFDVLLRYIFEKDNRLGMVGFVGSDEMAENGSRLWGTTSNFLGKTYSYKDESWTGTPASLHGQRYDGLTQCVVIDGCVMALRRSAWENLKEPNYPPLLYYHYDRIMSCRMLEAGYTLASIGTACDHLNNMTGGNEKKWHDNVRVICQKNNIPGIKDETGEINWDISLHAEAKRLFILEWRDEKHFIPRKI